MSKPSSDRAAGRYLSATLCAALAMAACYAQPGASKPAQSATPNGKPVMLTITSYNYTNRYIDQFFVNGRGGGNVFVSTPTSGGGGGSCCVVYTPGTPVPKTVKVKWIASGCRYFSVDSGGEKYSRSHHFFREIDVPIDPKVPTNPVNFEVHFYPDGHVEAAITDGTSEPRLKLPPDRGERGYSPCPGGTKPTSNIDVETQR